MSEGAHQKLWRKLNRPLGFRTTALVFLIVSGAALIHYSHLTLELLSEASAHGPTLQDIVRLALVLGGTLAWSGLVVLCLTALLCNSAKGIIGLQSALISMVAGATLMLSSLVIGMAVALFSKG